MLMAAPRSVLPWDLVINKNEDGKIFIDARSSSILANLTVSETSSDPPSDPNERTSLSAEAMSIGRSFLSQVLKNDSGEYFDLSDDQDSVAMTTSASRSSSDGRRYRKWHLGDGLYLVARTHLDACMKYQDANALMVVRALNQVDTTKSSSLSSNSFKASEWHQRLDSQRGSVLATEMRSNGCKLARWTFQSLLSAADFMKIGYPKQQSTRVPRTSVQCHNVHTYIYMWTFVFVRIFVQYKTWYSHLFQVRVSRAWEGTY